MVGPGAADTFIIEGKARDDVTSPRNATRAGPFDVRPADLLCSTRTRDLCTAGFHRKATSRRERHQPSRTPYRRRRIQMAEPDRAGVPREAARGGDRSVQDS